MSAITYRRVEITGTLTLNSELHIGTGAREGDEHTFNTLVKDKDGKPYIPGSSLRGLLASLTGDATYRERWFGLGRGKADDHGAMGALRVYDAVAKQEHVQNLMSRTAIDPVTGTAKQHHLATHDRVPAGTVFTVEMGFDTKPGSIELITEGEVLALLQVLAGLNDAQLGMGKSIGQGALRWALERVEGLSDKDFFAWLQNNLRNGKTKKGKTPQLNKYQPAGFKPVVLAAVDTLSGVWRSEHFELVPESAILINNPHDPEVKLKQNPDTPIDERKQLASLVFLHDEKNHFAVIPGSTIKGWFRAHCRRILMTLVQDGTGLIDEKAEARVDEALNELFGGLETGQSLLRFYDARLRYADDDMHTQTFNAVDRFTGGVKDTALYKVKALRTHKTFKGRMVYHEAALQLPENAWMNLLLLFVRRDAEEGDLVLGWGKAKGFGQVLLKPSEGRWLGELDDEILSDWEHSLQLRLGIKREKETAV